MDFLEDRDFSDIPNIPEYYKDKTIFITGGSGFMGKVLVEKLLYSCSDLNRIYLLLRDKKGVKSEDRLNVIYTSKCFDRLRNEKPDIFKKKVFFIAGDVSELGLGISDEDRTLIINRTNIIFHVAASVRFDDSLKVAAKLNLRGTREVIELAKEVRNLEAEKLNGGLYYSPATSGDCVTAIKANSIRQYTKRATVELLCLMCVEYINNEYYEPKRSIKYLQQVYIHVSTSYANATTRINCIDEVIYPALSDWRDTLEVSEKMDEHTLKVLTPKYLGELPNTYVFTKQLAEQVVKEQRGKLPIVIMRPSIVVGSNREPLVGWMENFNGPVGLLTAVAIGILRVLLTSADLETDFIAVDIAIKSFITAAWERGTKKTLPTDQIQVYHCTTGDIKTLTSGEVMAFGRTVIQNEIPLENTLWPPSICLTTSKLEYNLKVLLYHFLPALVIDLGLKISGNKPMLTKVQRRIYVANVAVQYFISNQWKFTNKNLLTLRSKIKEEDIKDFYYEMETIDYEEFFRKAFVGAKIFILNEKMENIPKAKKRDARMKLLDRTLKIALKAYVFWFIINTEFVLNILQSMYSFVFGI